MKDYGKIDWAFTAGRIPLVNTGREPDFISYDKIAVLNTSDEEAVIEMNIFYEDEQPSEIYSVKVSPKRLRKIRFNDLIDPLPIRLGRNYSCIIKTNVPVVVQFSQMDTGARENAKMSGMAFPADN